MTSKAMFAGMSMVSFTDQTENTGRRSNVIGMPWRLIQITLKYYGTSPSCRWICIMCWTSLCYCHLQPINQERISRHHPFPYIFCIKDSDFCINISNLTWHEKPKISFVISIGACFIFRRGGLNRSIPVA